MSRMTVKKHSRSTLISAVSTSKINENHVETEDVTHLCVEGFSFLQWIEIRRKS